MYYLKNNDIPDGFTAPGLEEARKRLQYDKLSEQEKIDYHHHLKQRLYEQSSISTAIMKGETKGEAKGRAEGEAIGLEKGEAIGRAAERTEVQEKVVINSHQAGLAVETISSITGLTSDRIIEILKRHGLL